MQWLVGNKEKADGDTYREAHPTNNALLINFRLSSNAEIFVNKHRLSKQIDAKRAKKTCMQRVRIPTELLFLHATVGGWAGEEDEDMEEEVERDCSPPPPPPKKSLHAAFDVSRMKTTRKHQPKWLHLSSLPTNKSKMRRKVHKSNLVKEGATSRLLLTRFFFASRLPYLVPKKKERRESIFLKLSPLVGVPSPSPSPSPFPQSSGSV